MKWLVLACAMAGLVVLGLGPGSVPDLVPVVAGWGDEPPAPGESRRYVFFLPDGAVVVRGLSRSEWASYQVRAEAWEWIECDMMAAAIVAPAMTASEAAALSDSVSRSLRRAINEASGFAAFPELAP